jgi:hypothetical protein
MLTLFKERSQLRLGCSPKLAVSLSLKKEYLYSASLSNSIVTFHPNINLLHAFLLFQNYSIGELNLGFNHLNGTIPNEVGQLRQLGEYTRE